MTSPVVRPREKIQMDVEEDLGEGTQQQAGEEEKMDVDQPEPEGKEGTG